MSRRIGPYVVEGELGRGAMGVVWRARHATLGRLVALKQLGDCRDPQSLQRFRTEAAALARLRHPNVVAVHDSGEEGGLPWFAMELVEGESLERVLERGPVDVRRRSSGSAPSRAPSGSRTSAGSCTGTSSPRTSSWERTGRSG